MCAGNIRTVDYAGPYNLSLLSVQADEIQGDAALSVTFYDYIKSCAHCLEYAALCLLCFALALTVPTEMRASLDTVNEIKSSEMLFNAAGIAAKQSFTDKDIIDFLTNVE